MKFRHVGCQEERKIELQMTPMIDIVFQLLTFFIMSFKIVAQEGDFNIQMPLAAQQQGLPEDSPLVTLHIRLRADAAGRLLSRGGIIVNGERTLDSMEALHTFIIGVVGGDEPSARADAEVEFDVDYGLHYEHIIDAITAVSGYVDRATGRVEKLIEKIKFTPPADTGTS